jgi:hypothetical protein
VSRTSAVAEADLHQILVCPDVEGGTAAPARTDDDVSRTDGSPRTDDTPQTDDRTDLA